jgi:hypothetical protein
MTTLLPASIILVDERGLVAARHNSPSASLPQVDIADGRVGICLSRAVREQLRLNIYCLVPSAELEPSFHLVRLQSPEQVLPSGYIWTKPQDLLEHKQIEQALAGFTPTDTEFGRFGWYAEVTTWLREQVDSLGYEIRRFEQWNGRVGGVLLRVLTDGPDFWFKAVSQFNTREFWVSQLLAKRHPKYFPRVLAAEPRWNAFLLEDVRGEELHDHDDLDTWKYVAELLAEIQIEWVGQSSVLLASGAADLRSSSIAQRLPAFLSHIADAMTRQTKVPPAILNRRDLDDLGDQLETMCARVSAFAFAEGLANADFSPHNTLITAHGPVFIDWAEACVSLPLIAGEYMWNRMVVEAPQRRYWQDALRNTYLSRWRDHFGKDALDVAARLLPAFSVLAVAMFYHERERTGPSPYDSYLRSLARQLQRETGLLQIKRHAMLA